MLIIEIENIINCRFITFTSKSFDNPSPLRPIDFIASAANCQSFRLFEDNESGEPDLVIKQKISY